MQCATAAGAQLGVLCGNMCLQHLHVLRRSWSAHHCLMSMPQRTRQCVTCQTWRHQMPRGPYTCVFAAFRGYSAPGALRAVQFVMFASALKSLAGSRAHVSVSNSSCLHHERSYNTPCCRACCVLPCNGTANNVAVRHSTTWPHALTKPKTASRLRLLLFSPKVQNMLHLHIGAVQVQQSD